MKLNSSEGVNRLQPWLAVTKIGQNRVLGYQALLPPTLLQSACGQSTICQARVDRRAAARARLASFPGPSKRPSPIRDQGAPATAGASTTTS